MAHYLQMIQEKKGGFTKSYRLIADYIEKHIGEVAFLSIQELSHRINISTATIHRFCQEIGLSGYAEFQKEIQEHIRQDYKKEASQIDFLSGEQSILISEAQRNIKILQEMMANSRELAENLPMAARLILSARRVYIMGLQGDYGSAYSLYFSLLGLRDNVYLLSLGEGNLSDQISRITEEDLILIISFRVHNRSILDVINCFVKRNAKIISVTDDGSPFSAFSTVSLVPQHETRSYGSVLKVTIERALILTVTRLLREETPQQTDEYNMQEVYEEPPRG